MRPARTVLLLSLAAIAGGAAARVTPVPQPPAGSTSVTAVVFYDENGNGELDPSEAVRLPGVVVEVAGHTGRTEKGGRVVIAGVPAGTHTVSIRAETLPPFARAGAGPVTLQAPRDSEIALPVTWPIGQNQPNTYMAFGDSITDGDGSKDDNGYRSLLEAAVTAHFGAAAVLNESEGGTTSAEGATRIAARLQRVRPASTLILYGTNDWYETECQKAAPCFTIESLRTMVRAVRAGGSLPFLATLIPANPARSDRVPHERNEWVAQEAVLIRAMAREEGAALVDLEAAFRRQGDLTTLFSDHVHPNDRGYRIIADAFFKAITERP